MLRKKFCGMVIKIIFHHENTKAKKHEIKILGFSPIGVPDQKNK
jgi:hypothetical protein